MKLSPKSIEDLSERNEGGLDALKKRLIFPAILILFFFGLIMLRLWTLQVINGEEYANRADTNRVRERQIVPPRGRILDRNGIELVTNRPSFNVVMVRDSKKNVGGLLEKISPILQEDVTELWARVREAKGKAAHEPVILKEDIDWETLAYLENHKPEFPGVRVELQPVRVYHYQDLAANLIGYLGSISKKELEKSDDMFYRGGDIIGKAGIERLREKDLRGEKGKRSSEVNSRGFEQQLLKKIDPLPGNDLYLTLDVGLQQTAEGLMNAADKAGAVVAMEVKTGRLLVAASTPTIHIEDFVGGISVENWKALLENPRLPLINKVVQATYPPGSTYKMIAAFAGLAEGVIDKDTVFYCSGKHKFGNRYFRCWKKVGHGPVNLRRAIAESCDVYFYEVGERLGVDTLAKYAKMFGLGVKSGVEIEHERNGLVPTKAWKKKVKKQRWMEGETLNVAIGQGFNLTTPLQICMMTATIANRGKLYQPQLVEKVVDADEKVIEQFTPKLVSEIKGKKSDYFFELIQQGMEDVVQGTRGTARQLKIDGLTIAGKTGTAQVVHLSKSKGLKDYEIPYKERDHAWFTAYAPAEDPEIAVTVLVEHGLHGGSGAGPVVRAILKEYFRDRLQAARIEKNNDEQ